MFIDLRIPPLFREAFLQRVDGVMVGFTSRTRTHSQRESLQWTAEMMVHIGGSKWVELGKGNRDIVGNRRWSKKKAEEDEDQGGGVENGDAVDNNEEN